MRSVPRVLNKKNAVSRKVKRHCGRLMKASGALAEVL
jgi:hypothetical protein